ncbi:MAG: SRPBCC family protein [Deltaproteobacteria bacterium]|nr:SRPBCC family protein [Deltaproteobacteria bacterium]
MRLEYATDSVVIGRPVGEVFNFVARAAQYHRWHFDYHLRAEALDIRPEGVGSAFSIEELIDGFYLRHVGRVTIFERDRRLAWRGRFAMCSWIWIGTDFRFAGVSGGTRVEETLYFELSPLVAPAALLFVWRPAFRPVACRAHVRDELTGIKTMLESGDHDPRDVTDPLTDERLLERVKGHRGESSGR